MQFFMFLVQQGIHRTMPVNEQILVFGMSLQRVVNRARYIAGVIFLVTGALFATILLDVVDF